LAYRRAARSIAYCVSTGSLSPSPSDHSCTDSGIVSPLSSGSGYGRHAQRPPFGRFNSGWATVSIARPPTLPRSPAAQNARPAMSAGDLVRGPHGEHVSIPRRYRRCGVLLHRDRDMSPVLDPRSSWIEHLAAEDR